MQNILLKFVANGTKIWILTILLVIIGARPSDSTAMLAPPLPTMADFSDSYGAMDLPRIRINLESKIIRQRLDDIGYTPEETYAAVAKLTDDQLHEIARDVDAIFPVGHGPDVVVVLLLFACLVVILV